MFGAEVYLRAWRWSAWGAWSAWVCAHPPTVAQCLSSKGFYPTACALFVIRGLLIPGDVLFWGFLRLSWQAVLMSVLQLVHTTSVHAESGDPRVEKSMH